MIHIACKLVSICCNHIAEEERTDCYVLIVFFLSYGLYFSVSLLRSTMGWYVSVIAVFPGHTSFF